MYLKSIEIQGFKSFANRLVFEFHNGITGIVGPNGSGKSNVADAVRWVLGEQRIRQLRGASMQDVIFAGTQLRKPQGFAYVAITLDNSDHQLAIDFDEVTVSRRLYRSGESEYMLNGSACRLKDINELFYDTGIGREGYSIIGQGQVDRILSGKPEERRELFDEAAGIVKFKRRKAVAEKKLEDERQNLVRVSDILAELEKQVGPLAKQSEAAKQYLALKEQLKTCDVNLFLIESDNIDAQLKETKEKEQLVADDMAEAKTLSEQHKAEYDRLEQAVAGLEAQIGEKRTLSAQAEVLCGNLEGQINVLNEQINTENMNEEHIRSRREAIESDLAEKRGQSEGYEMENQTLADAVAESHGVLRLAEDKLRREDEGMMLLDSQIEEAKGAIITGLNERAELTARGQRFEAMLEQIQVRKAEVSQRLIRQKSEESEHTKQLEAEQKQLADAQERSRKLEQERAACEVENGKLEQEVRQLNRMQNDQQQQCRAAETRLETLRNLAERYDGYGNSIRRVMETRSRVRGIRGVVADLITTEKQYETAIETALGGSIQNVVTDTEETAKQLIEYLKKNRYGRMTFLPLSGISRGSRGQGLAKPEALREEGVIGLASGLVKTDPQYQVLADYLLGRIVVTDNIDHAIALARKYRYSLRIVTLDGELLSAGGSMTGGAFKNTSNLLGRRREIEELENALKEAQAAVKQTFQELTQKEALLSVRKLDLEQLVNDCHEASLALNTAQISVSQLSERRDDIHDATQDLELEYSQLEAQIREITQEREKLSEDETLLAQQGEEATRRSEELNARLETAKARREEAAKQLEESRLNEANVRQRLAFVTENLQRVADEIARLEQEKEELKASSEGSAHAVAQKQEEILRLRGLIDNAKEQRTVLDQEITALQAQKEETAAGQKDFFEKREQLADRVSRLDKELFRLQSQKEKLEEKLERQVDYMWSEYGLTLSTAQPLRDETLSSANEIRRRGEELKTAIRGLGNVNVNAIEDYKEISERYEFMKTQHDDLARAEESLLSIIEELNTGMRRQFTEKFGEIRLEFDRVFKELFGGGHGTLELMEDVDILAAGVQIIAQPPGKKLQNMMQLSGGEKALTAIALLFAIQNLKPSPFCLLDEIEAALDDSNVDRFARYLHKLTKSTQFIVITHRRGTMVSADRLYGITMQEKGVSTLVSVSLIEDQLDQ
ncbi:MAG: chromosome segregation protein SMC [Clostridiales bacterium]|nr:chromosome segregation protein SMC [Clostridiales bacterium]